MVFQALYYKVRDEGRRQPVWFASLAAMSVLLPFISIPVLLLVALVYLPVRSWLRSKAAGEEFKAMLGDVARTSAAISRRATRFVKSGRIQDVHSSKGSWVFPSIEETSVEIPSTRGIARHHVTKGAHRTGAAHQ